MTSWAEREARRGEAIVAANTIFWTVVGAALLTLAVATGWATATVADGIITLGLGIGLFFAGRGGVRHLRAWAHPRQSRFWESLRTYGDPNVVSGQIEAELAGPAQVRGEVTLTEHWMVWRGVGVAWVSPLADLIWFYPVERRLRVNGAPMGKRNACVVRTRRGASCEIPVASDQGAGLRAELARRAPQARQGYDAKLDAAWQQDPMAVVAGLRPRAGPAERT